MVDFLAQDARSQASLPTEPYDRWVLSDGTLKAEFHRLESGAYLMRLIDEADFEIFPDEARVIGWPAPDCPPDHFISLFTNAVLPVLGNHQGGLFLHGSAVAVAGHAVAFLGHSRSGKTTLAGAFAKAGHPFMTEDVIDLVKADDAYWLQPKPSGLRVFADSASFLLGERVSWDDPEAKQSIACGGSLQFRADAAPLAAIFLLGDDPRAALSLRQLAPQEVVANLLPHSFLLDVEDKARLKSHFGRVVELSLGVACYSLDYIREYSQLTAVLQAITAKVAGKDRT